MRTKLKAYRETRGTFTGIYERDGFKNGWLGMDRTLLLKDIKDKDGNILCDHLWFNFTKGFQKAGPFQKGDVIQFDGRCAEYEKGYKGWREDVFCPISTDYKLSYPTKIKKIATQK